MASPVYRSSVFTESPIEHIVSPDGLLLSHDLPIHKPLPSIPWYDPFNSTLNSSSNTTYDGDIALEFPLVDQRVEDWFQTLFDLYTSLHEKSECAQRRLWMLTLKELGWYKEGGDVEGGGGGHEYVVAKIADPQNGTVRHLRLDRVPASVVPISERRFHPMPRFVRKNFSVSSFSTSTTSSSSSSYSLPSFVSRPSSRHTSPTSSIDSSTSILDFSITKTTDTVRDLEHPFAFPVKGKKAGRHLNLIERVVFRCTPSPSTGSRSPTLFDLALAAKVVHDYRHPRHESIDDSSWFSTILVRLMQNGGGFCYSVKYRDPTAASFHHWRQPVVDDIVKEYRETRARSMDKIKSSAAYFCKIRERASILSETCAQRDVAMALATEASTSAAKASARARDAAARMKEVETLADYESASRARAEEKVEQLKVENRAMEKEMKEMKRRVAAAGLDSFFSWSN